MSSIATGSPRPNRTAAEGRSLSSSAARPSGSAFALTLPLGLACALAALCLLPQVRQHPMLGPSLLGASGFIVAWTGLYFYIAGPQHRSLRLDIVVRKQHYLQALTQFAVMLYWGWYWREVYHSLHLIGAQLLFAYAFDMLLGWSRRGSYTLGFGPFPIIFSINLFLWFKPDWFYLQFLMVAVGFLAKEFITWEKDGRRSHIFNPSSFPLGLFSLGLILTGSTHITWAQEIAQTFQLPPHIFLWIFLVCLPVQFLFGITTMTMSAVLSVVAFGLAYHGIFGTYYFIDGFMPAAVFLGMHLLFTDPATAPRTELGRILYGVLYGLGVLALFGLLGRIGVPTFYDKLMAVPVLNLCIQLIDAAARSTWLRAVDPARFGKRLGPLQRNGVYIALWVVGFVVFSDPAAAYRPRRWVPFWEQACADQRHNGCLVLSQLETRYCRQGSAWACNELGVLEATDRARSGISAQAAFGQACAQGLRMACDNRALMPEAATPPSVADFQRSTPTLADYPVLLQEGSGPPSERAPAALYEAACHQGWADGCEHLAGWLLNGSATARDVPRAVQVMAKACDLKSASACGELGALLLQGVGVAADPRRGHLLLQQACSGGYRTACVRLQGRGSGDQTR